MTEPLEGRRLLAAAPVAPVSLPDNPAGTMYIDVGGVAPLADATGTTAWAPDAAFAGGKRVAPRRLAVEGTEDDALFASRRQGDFTYTIPVADGRYTLSMLFADTVKKAGKRVFNVFAQNALLEQNVDVAERVGARTALTLTHDVTVTGGALDLAFVGVKGRAVLSGISLVAAQEAAQLSPGEGESGGTAGDPTSAPMGDVTITWANGTRAPAGHVDAGGIQVGEKMYVWGGFTGGDHYEVQDRMDVLDLTTGKWSPRRPSPAPQTHLALATDGVRYIYAAGGQYGGGLPGRASADVWRYDTVDDLWTADVLPELPEARYASAMALSGNKLYFFGGTRPDRATVAHDLWVLDLNSPGAGWVAKAPLPPGLSGDHLSAAVVNGIIYAVGGEHGHARTEDDDAPYIQHDFLMAYDPALDAWTRKADLPQGSSHAEYGTLVINGKIVMLGGQIDDLKVTADTRLYDPATDTWEMMSPLPERRKAGIAAYLNGKIFYTGGQRDGDFHVPRTTWVGTLTGL